MVILAVNCGSSSVKCRLFDVATSGPRATGARLLEERVLTLRTDAGVLRKDIAVDDDDHAAGVERLLQELTSASRGLPRIEAVGHRVVHGGSRFRAPVVIDEPVLNALESLDELAPLHNRTSLAGVRAARAVLGPAVPMVGVFDTAFHASLPDRAWRYAILDRRTPRIGLD